MAKLVFSKNYFFKRGKFDEEKAKAAIMKLCKFHKYPLFPQMPEGLWVSDYGMGDFGSVGLAALGFVNHLGKDGSYMLQDLFLLPGQMLPEHWHEEPAKASVPVKNEGWLVRHGSCLIVGKGKDNLPSDIVIPKIHHKGKVTAKHAVFATPGTFVELSAVKTRHWMMAGPEGVILTEVANAHDNASVRHTDKVANVFFLAGLK